MTLGPTLRPVLGPSLGLGINRGALPIPRVVTPPSGFDWTPPLSVIKQGNSFKTNFAAATWKVAATADVWVSTTGSDTTGTGTQALPYRSIKKGLQAAAALSDAAVNLYVQAGIYDRRYSFSAQSCAKDLNIIAVGGRAISSQRFEPLTWTLNTTGVYQAARAAVATVWDASFPDSDGVPTKLVSQTSLAACQSTAGSWYTDGTTLYVHTQNGRIPDTSLLVIAAVTNANFDSDHHWYVENIDFEGGSGAPFNVVSTNVFANARLVFNACKFRFGATASGNGHSINGVPLVINYGCLAYANEADGFNYHAGTNGNTYALEINCQAWGNGQADGVNNDNGSTIHDSCRIVRVSGAYRSTIGPVVADINAAMSWNLGCSSDLSLSGNSVSNAGWLTQDTAQMWLDTCEAHGSHFSANANSSTAAIYTRNCTLVEATGGPVAPY